MSDIMAASSGNPLADIAIERIVSELSASRVKPLSLGIQKLAYEQFRLNVRPDSLEGNIRARQKYLFPIFNTSTLTLILVSYLAA